MTGSSGRELALELLQKSRDDADAAGTLAAAGSADWLIGFHAQQAVEKALKAVLTDKAVVFPRTHDIVFLLQQVEQAGIEEPPDSDGAATLGPWAVEFRYSTAIDERLDATEALRVVESIRGWAERLT